MCRKILGVGLPGKYSGPPSILWISNCIFNDGFRRNATANEGLAGLIYPSAGDRSSPVPGKTVVGGWLWVMLSKKFLHWTDIELQIQCCENEKS